MDVYFLRQYSALQQTLPLHSLYTCEFWCTIMKCNLSYCTCSWGLSFRMNGNAIIQHSVLQIHMLKWVLASVITSHRSEPSHSISVCRNGECPFSLVNLDVMCTVNTQPCARDIAVAGVFITNDCIIKVNRNSGNSRQFGPVSHGKNTPLSVSKVMFPRVAEQKFQIFWQVTHAGSILIRNYVCQVSGCAG